MSNGGFDDLMMVLSTLLFENGLPDLEVSLIEPHRNGLGRWRIKFCYESNEPLSMSSAQAANMAVQLHHIGAAEMASQIDDAVRRAERYETM